MTSITKAPAASARSAGGVPRPVPSPVPASGFALRRIPVRHLDIDFERGDRAAAVHFDLHLVAVDRHVLSDHRQDLLLQGHGEVAAAAEGTEKSEGA